MRTYQLRFLNGETAELRELDDGSWPCPICGEPWVCFPPYSPNDGNLGNPHPVSSEMLGEVCPGCGVEFGVDVFVVPYSPIGMQKKQWAYFRVKWLNKVGWSRQALDQLWNNLGISEEQVRSESKDVESMDQQKSD